MNRLLSHKLWPTISKLARTSVKRAAIAYVSSDKHVAFGDGDILICDASKNAIKAGQTSALVLKRAYDRNASLFTLPGLHAKIILLNEKAIIGSANASASSANDLIEVGLLTDQPTIVASAQAFVDQLAGQATQLTEKRLHRLLKIKVVKRPRSAGYARTNLNTRIGGHRTWIIGTTELLKDPPEDQAILDEAVQRSRDSLTNPRSNVFWIRWTGSSNFRESCQKGDWLIQMWKPAGPKQVTCVYERMPVLDRVDFETATYFFYEEFPKSDSRSKTWGKFRKLAVRAGIKRQIKPRSRFEITENEADSLQALWNDD